MVRPPPSPPPHKSNNRRLPPWSAITLSLSGRSVDNSEWMRNGDYVPNRLEAQTDAAIQVAARKRDQNPENTVGVLSMAGKKGVQVLCPLVSTMQDLGKILAVLHSREKIRIDGTSNFVAALKTATLALKHRSEKKLRQRVVMFVGSPIDAEPKELEKTGKALKKNGVAVDIISFGDAESNNEKLEALINGVNKDGNRCAPYYRLSSPFLSPRKDLCRLTRPAAAGCARCLRA